MSPKPVTASPDQPQSNFMSARKSHLALQVAASQDTVACIPLIRTKFGEEKARPLCCRPFRALQLIVHVVCVPVRCGEFISLYYLCLTLQSVARSNFSLFMEAVAQLMLRNRVFTGRHRIHVNTYLINLNGLGLTRLQSPLRAGSP